nr:hypothetical protein [Vibrio mimicus]
MASVSRCSPLNKALVSLRKIHQKFKLKALKNQLLAFNLHYLAFEFLTDDDLVESVENSAVSRCCKPISLDASRLLDVQHWKFGFTKAASSL